MPSSSQSYKADLEEALEELNDMREDWKPEKEPNMDEEIELIKKWVKEREDFINGFIGLVITGFFIFIICLSRRGTN